MANEKPAGMVEDRGVGAVNDPGLGAGENISKTGAVDPSKSGPSYDNVVESFLARAKEKRMQRLESQKQKQEQGQDAGPELFHHYGKFAETEKLAEEFAKGYIEASKNPKHKIEVYRIKEQLKKNPRKFLEEHFSGLGKTEYTKRKALYPLIKKLKKELPYIKSFPEQEKKRRQLKALEVLVQKQKKSSTASSTKKIIDLPKQSRRKTSGFSSLLQSLRGKKPA